MLLGANEIVSLMRNQDGCETSLAIVPNPDIEEVKKSGSASIDLRLGRWFRTLRQSRTSLIKIPNDDEIDEGSEARITKEYFVRFDDYFILHPGKFVLGTTLEWLRFPSSLAGYITGKSSWGRRGLIIETAAGIHPGFSGCLTLELSNLGEVPIRLEPGMQICQVFFHEVQDPDAGSNSQFRGRRKPTLGSVKRDSVLRKLQQSN